MIRGMGNLIAHIWASMKLRRGQCKWCKAPLRDDQKEFCSNQCGVDHQQRYAW